MPATLELTSVAKKTTGKKASAKTTKRYGVMVRVSEVFANALKEAAAEELMSAAEFCNTRLLPVVRKLRDDMVLKKAADVQKERSRARSKAAAEEGGSK